MRVEPQPVRTRTAGRASNPSGSTRPMIVDLHGNTAGLGKLVECGRQATARGVAEATRAGRCGQNGGNQVVERRGIAFDRARKCQALALAHDGDPVVAQCA